jgi:transcriptional regulator with PAS, ATPase and Fis domain
VATRCWTARSSAPRGWSTRPVILLTGETGSGKEIFAKALHESSERPRPALRRRQLRGHSRVPDRERALRPPAGQPSPAPAKGKRGLIQEADGGTLFLDEIGDMPRDMQARLLRVLAEREVLPIGATRPVPVNLRVIAATNRDLQRWCARAASATTCTTA